MIDGTQENDSVENYTEKHGGDTEIRRDFSVILCAISVKLCVPYLLIDSMLIWVYISCYRTLFSQL